MIKIPLTWEYGKKKIHRISLTMNWYRNVHYQTSNKVKKMVADYVKSFDLGKFSNVKIVYTVYFKDRSRRDLLNFVSVVDKFALDALVDKGVLIDDSYQYVREYGIKFGGIVDENYVEMEIIEIGG